MKFVWPIGVKEEEQRPRRVYVDENLAAGIEGSCVPAEHFDATQSEILYCIEQSGLTPDGEDYTQLWQVLQKLQRDTRLQPGPNGSTLMTLGGEIVWQPGKVPKDLTGEYYDVYVRTDGNDNNDGSANDADHAFATIQGALTYLSGFIYTGDGAIRVLVGAGPYVWTSLSADVVFLQPRRGYAVGVYAGQRLQIKSQSGSNDVFLQNNSTVNTGTLFPLPAAMEFCNISFRQGAAAVAHSYGFAIGTGSVLLNCAFSFNNNGVLDALGILSSGSRLVGDILITYTGKCQSVFICNTGQTLWGIYAHEAKYACTIQIIGSVTVSTATVVVYSQGVIYCEGTTSGFKSFTGTITGPRYSVQYPGVLNTQGRGANCIPGSTAGTATMPTALIF